MPGHRTPPDRRQNPIVCPTSAHALVYTEIMLTDLVCHGEDIRRPTGMFRRVPESTLRTVAETVKRIGFPLHAKRRIAGVRIEATDVDWSAGDGPCVEGPLASLILVMAGRTAPLEALSGPGKQMLQARM